LLRTWTTLKEKSEIKELFRKGRRKSDRNLTIYYRKSSKGLTRVLFCADKSSKIAVERNRVKRVLRALLRDESILLPTEYDIALVGGMGFIKKKFPERKEIFNQLMKNVYHQ